MKNTHLLSQELIAETKPIVTAWAADRDDFGKTLACVRQVSRNLNLLHVPLDRCAFYARSLQDIVGALQHPDYASCCRFFCSPERTLMSEIQREIDRIHAFREETLSQIFLKNSGRDLNSDPSFVVSEVNYSETNVYNRRIDQHARTYEIGFIDNTKLVWHSLDEDELVEIEKRFHGEVSRLKGANTLAPST